LYQNLYWQYENILLLQSLTGGVWTLHAPGNSRALVVLIVTPSEEAPPARTEQRHFGLFCTTLDNAEQHEEDGVEELPVM
jgi:hypothetical protein